MRKHTITRHGKNASEVRRKWAWENPDTVVENIVFNGTTRGGKREYMIFYHERQKQSKRSKLVESLKRRGAKYGR